MVLLPKQEAWDKTLYKLKNPICPHLIYECCKRIFGRKEHGCLNASNKPKVIDVVLKFAKLHDKFDFDDQQQLQSYFDHSVVLDFMRYGSRKEPLLPETLSGLIQAYNETPENFGSPSDETVDRVIALLDKQIALDEESENLVLISNLAEESGYKKPHHGSTQKWSNSPSPKKSVNF